MDIFFHIIHLRFLKGYEIRKSDPEINEIVDSTKKYRNKLRVLGIEDYQVYHQISLKISI